jgi:hypothetical protein
LSRTRIPGFLHLNSLLTFLAEGAILAAIGNHVMNGTMPTLFDKQAKQSKKPDWASG